MVADHVPKDERFLLGPVATKVHVWLHRHFPPAESGLPSINADPSTAIERAYDRRYHKYVPTPEIPREYQGPIDLGSLAVAGPYFCYLRCTSDGNYEWDLRHLGEYECHPGLRRLGARVLFEVNQDTRRLEAVEIECELGVRKPGDPEWELAQRIALCTATTDVSLVRHFVGIHLALVGRFSIATRNVLPANHCIRRLLWPHVWASQYSNEMVTEIFMMPGGEFEGIFSFTYDELCRLLAKSYADYDIRAVTDPLANAESRGILDKGFDLPALDNRVAHWKVMYDHAHRYLTLYYSCDQDLRDDAAVVEWLRTLDRSVPGGVKKMLDHKITIDGVATLIAAYIYAVSVEHEILGSGLWNYQLWTHVQPVRIYQNGRREPIDIYQRLVNYNFSVNVERAQLMQDFSYLAGKDDAAARAFSTFLSELTELQLRLKTEPHEHWKVYPADLEVSVNG
ncbi:MAG: lipoxygenase family protein [Pseudonocardiaceae bacterium]